MIEDRAAIITTSAALSFVGWLGTAAERNEH
jgi:hypothetical protein